MSSNGTAARVIAFYLPQFHPIPENDEWWGKGFTEWTNTAKAKPLFKDHYQPHVPADLGFYDLRLSETRIAQAEMAKAYGIEAFCYYHYWFAGRRLLERPFAEVLESGEPDFPFCLCWANHSWSGVWNGAPDRVLIDQTYPGDDDHRRHFKVLMRAFLDRRYTLVDGKPLFVIYRPTQIPEVRKTTDLWRDMAKKAGLSGLYLVAITRDLSWVPKEHGFDAFIFEGIPFPRSYVSRRKPVKWLIRRYQDLLGRPTVYAYERVIPDLIAQNTPNGSIYPWVIPNWDNTPRSGKNGMVLHGSTPELFSLHLKNALRAVQDRELEHRIIFVKSWNEWAEGNHLEPDLKFGKAYLSVIKNEVLT